VKQNYVEHNAAVRAFCKEQERPLLDYDVAMGWQPLCEFLGKDTPTEEFPRLNDTESFQKEWATILAEVRKGIHKKMLLLGLGVAGVGLALYRNSI
jgi:hypothetical protein